jgi:hypothetical protein
MKDKILFWIDIEFIYFGIAKHFCQNYDCDAYAIIDVNEKAKTFFQKQKDVSFKKIWNYLDDVEIKKSLPDKKYLSEFEKKYGINLWNLVYGERSFHKFNEFYTFTDDEILNLIEQECRLYEEILNEVKPDFIIIKVTDWHHNQLFYEICKAKGIRILMTIPTRLGFRTIISERIDRLDLDLKNDNDDLKFNSFTELQKYLKNYSSFNQAIKFTKEYRKFNSNKLKTSLRFFLNPFNTKYQKRYSNYKATRIKIFTKYFNLAIKRFLRERFIEKNFLTTIPESKFIFFPMHFEPERTLSTDAPFFTNQLEVITNIAKSLPIDFKLVVKEHPVMKTLGWRNISYYKKILKLPNVILLNPSILPDEIYDKCTLVITITGTAGFEAIIHNKPAIIFADVIYAEISSVRKLQSIEELPQLIKTMKNQKVELNEVVNFVKKISHNSFEFDKNQLSTDFSSMCYYGGFLIDENLSEEKIENFLILHENSLKNVAFEHIKKIQYLKKISKF